MSSRMLLKSLALAASLLLIPALSVFFLSTVRSSGVTSPAPAPVVFTGYVRLNGPAPAPKTLVAGAERRCEGTHEVDRVRAVPDGGIEGVVVRLVDGEPAGRAGAPPTEPAVARFRARGFERDVLLASPGQVLALASEDSVLHAARGELKGEPRFTRALLPGTSPDPGSGTSIFLEEEGVLELFCVLHPWERAHVVVSRSRTIALTDENGRFAIPNVTPGRYQLIAWHPALGEREDTITVDGATVAEVLLPREER